ncbi:hypothetical protein D3C72_2097790 [compost metagenome]
MSVKTETGDVCPSKLPITTRASMPPSLSCGSLCRSVWSKIGSISSLWSGSASQVCNPEIERSCPRWFSGERSEWTMPRPAVIRFTSPGRITISVPRLSRCLISPSNR